MLIGRATEQREIDALLASARLGQSGVLVMTGEPGIGKSALLRHAISRAEGFRVLRMTGSETERSLPFAGLAGLLRPLTGQLDRLPAPQADALAVALALRTGPPVDRFAVAAGVLSLLTQVSEDQPVALVVDDAHVLDQSSADALVFASRRLLADAVCVLVALRDGIPAPWTAAGLPVRALAGLDLESARELATATSALPIPSELLHHIVDHGAGNPLAIQELARDPAPLHEASPATPAPLPDVVARAFDRRAAGLAPDDRKVLLVTAVADGDVPIIDRVCTAAGLDLSALDRAELLGLVRVTGQHAYFSHGLARSAVYATAPADERRLLHGLVADALPAADVDRRAWHRCAATLGVDAEVAAEIEAVGKRASERGAHAVAATAYERAARLSDGDEARARRFLAAGEEAWYAADDASAVAHLREALRHDPAYAATARARHLEGLVAARSGSLDVARDVLLRAAGAAVSTEPEQALLMYADAISSCFYQLDVASANAAADRIEGLLARPGRLAESGKPEAVARIAVGMARILAGEPGADQIRAGVTGLAAPTTSGTTVQSGWEVIGTLYLREAGTGRDLVAQAVERRRANAAIGTLPHLLWHLARDDATTDRWTRAAAEYDEAAMLARECGQSTELGVTLAGLAWLTARRGRSTESRELAAEADGIARAHGLRMVTAWTGFAMAELSLSLGETEVAAGQLSELAAWLDELGVLDADLSPVPELVEALVSLGRRDDALRQATHFLDLAEAKGQPWALARAARVRGLLATERAEMERSFERAQRLHERTPDAFEAARTRLLYGERLRRARRRVDARVQLTEALGTFERLGATAWADIALGELNATGVTARRRETGPIVDLTPRELQIALLLTDGKTTREAAAALFLSPKTVEYHLRHVYAKLGIGSRPELVDSLSELGVTPGDS